MREFLPSVLAQRFLQIPELISENLESGRLDSSEKQIREAAMRAHIISLILHIEQI